MRAVVQRVTSARVLVNGTQTGSIDRGICSLIGVGSGDVESDARKLAEKIANLRIFDQMNHSLLDLGLGCLVVSQFTLYGDSGKGRRPSFTAAAGPQEAEPLIEAVSARLSELGVPTESGIFGAHMSVELTNDGPVTLILDV